jgi:hypothetical protein
MGFTDGLGVTDVVTVALVTVEPDPPTTETPPESRPPEATPTEQAAEATIEQTGAGPPPDGRS